MSSIDILVMLAIAGILILLGLVSLAVIDYLKTSKQSKLVAIQANPTVQAVENALIPHINEAIAAGLYIVEVATEKVDTAVANVDKKSVADAMYNILPTSIILDGVPIPVGEIKSIVPIERFEALVQSGYEAFHAKMLANEQYLVSQMAIYKPPTPIPVELDKALATPVPTDTLPPSTGVPLEHGG